MFTQNADGLMDCSVWAIQSEFEEIASPGGGVLMTHRQVFTARVAGLFRR